VRGTGWDTYGLGICAKKLKIPLAQYVPNIAFLTLPIVLAEAPIVGTMLLPSFVPIVVVQNWTEICQWTEDDYGQMVDRYEGWIANAHYWLRLSLWVPRNQADVEALCGKSPGCQQGSQEMMARQRPWISQQPTMEDQNESLPLRIKSIQDKFGSVKSTQGTDANEFAPATERTNMATTSLSWVTDSD
jgi:hypothetical protein